MLSFLLLDFFSIYGQLKNKAFVTVKAARERSEVGSVLRVDCCCMVSLSGSTLHRPLL